MVRSTGRWIVLWPLQSSSPTAFGRTPCAAIGAALAVTPNRDWPATRTTVEAVPITAIDHVRQWPWMIPAMASLSLRCGPATLRVPSRPGHRHAEYGQPVPQADTYESPANETPRVTFRLAAAGASLPRRP